MDRNPLLDILLARSNRTMEEFRAEMDRVHREEFETRRKQVNPRDLSDAELSELIEQAFRLGKR